MTFRKIFILFGLLALVFVVQAQQSQRLIQGWQFVKGDLGGIWEAIRPADAGSPETLPIWTNITLPHCVNAEDAVDPDVNYYQGPSWYKAALTIQNPYANGRTLLHFEGAGQKTEVYVYDQKAGSHVGGYDEFTIDITDAVFSFQQDSLYAKRFHRKIPVSIRTDNSRDLQMIPSNMSDFNVYGGLYRYVNLVYQPAVSIDKVFAKATVSNDEKTGQLSIAARLYHPVAVSGGTILWKLTDPLGRVIVQNQQSFATNADQVQLTNSTIKNPVLWSTDQPRLYSLEVEISSLGQTSKQVEEIGFRKAEFVKKGPFLLNGKRLLLQGTHRHEDAAGVGAALTEEMMRQEMILMKEMGVNFIRLGHYQQSRIILHLCDSLGILVWEEIPWCRGGLGGEIYQLQAKRMLTNMIEQHYNHPSVVIWGLGNENDWPGDFSVYDSVAVRNFMGQLNTLAHQLDSSRKTAIRRCDFCKDIVDVYSPSIWAGWYRGIYADYATTTRKEFDKVDHFFHAEWGGDSHAGRHCETPDKVLQNIVSGATDERPGDATLAGGAARASKDGDWSESYICNLIDNHLKEQTQMPWLTGSAQWAFRDFSTPIRPDNPVPYVNQKGVVERDLTPKESYYVFQAYWTTKPMAHIYGHTWPVRWGEEGEAKMIKVYSNCSEVELFVNGKSCGVKKRNAQDFPAAGFHWLVVLNKGQYEVHIKATNGKNIVTDTIHFEYETRKWEKPVTIILEKIATGKDMVTAQAKLLDRNGVTCLDAADWIRFGLAGDGKLIDNLGTSSGSRYVQLYNGRAVINIKTNGGKRILSVQSAGLPTAFLSF